MAKRQVQIVPAVLVKTVDEFNQSLAKISNFTKHIQIDITDGVFAPNQTVKLEEISWTPDWQVDLHLMTQDPLPYLAKMINMRPAMIILHAETKANLIPIFAKFKEFGIKTGLALLPSTVPSSVAETIKVVDHVMIFAGKLGEMGGQANLLQVNKIRLIHAINPEVEIGWDGGANMNNLFGIVRGGVNVINVGSAIAKADNGDEVYKAMTDLATGDQII